MKVLIKNKEAQAGVGSLVIFIALVLVAVVAGSVLIRTSGVMQSKSTTTTKEAAAGIGENIVVESIDGSRSSGDTYLTFLNITIKTAAGGSDVDITKVLLTAKSSTTTATLNYSGSTLSATRFRVVQLRGSSAMGSGDILYAFSSSAMPVLKSGDLVKLVVNSSAAGLNLAQTVALTITLAPEKGTSISLPVTLPAFGSSTSISIYP